MSGRRLLALCVLGASSQGVAAQSLDAFQDWLLGCDNRRACTAISLEPSSDVTGVHLSVARSGEGAAEPVLRVRAYDGRRGPWRIRLTLDGSAWPDLDATARDGTGEIEAALPAERVRPLLAALRDVGRASVTVLKGAEAGPEVPLRSRGLAAALRAMDQAQGRSGTVTALVQPGPRPAASLPAPPPLPVIAQARAGTAPLPERMPVPIARAVAAADCDEPPDTNPIRGWLDERTLLWGVLCTRGATRETFALFSHRKGDAAARPVALVTPGVAGGREAPNLLAGAAFDARTATLSFHDAGRSSGDCGSLGRFVWDGARFRAVHVSAMPDCRGVSSADWPVTWRAAVRAGPPTR
ncbi:DUF1176 domain-containing protein [Methylobacterium sp. WSM2598]|uniref:DUF1176 domain-containing protein n=1 Tax=Methylobacterium sp. WSM2598 TaxID=398261 RepID=UPI00037C93B0|nr:DUF1176 domain-containing protein [Methylobacterium sp. WSM2598]